MKERLSRVTSRVRATLLTWAGGVRRTYGVARRGATRAVAATRSRQGRRVIDRILGITGETLITLGTLIGLFVAWELWWTDIGANQAQAEIVSNLDWQNTQPQPAITAGNVPVAVDPVNVERHDEPPVIAEPAHATTFATMYVPRWGLDYVRPISEGTDKRGVLDPLGIGHYARTAMPGGWGNFSVAGHRTTYGKPFNRIEEIKVGDAVVIRTESTWYVYRVIRTEIVRPNDIGVIAPVPDHPGEAANGRYLTMTTCHPKYSAARRYIVHAELDYWMPSDAGFPKELLPVITPPATPSPTGAP